MCYWDGKDTEAAILLNYRDDENSQGYRQINEAFRALTKDDILKSHISDHDFMSSNVRIDEIGYGIFVFDIRDQKKNTSQ